MGGWAASPESPPRGHRGSEPPTRERDHMSEDVPVVITDHEQSQIDAANASKKTPVVFVHGLWLLPSSWENWAEVFEGAGFTTLTPGWPDDPNTVTEAKEHPEVMAHKTV